MINRALRNELRHAVTKCRKLLEAAVGDQLEGRLGVGRNGRIEDADRMGHLSKPEMRHRGQVISHLRHVEAGGFGPADAVSRLIREIAFTHLNRLCAYKMLERRRLVREAVDRGLNSNGFKFYPADHPEDEQRWSSGDQAVAYRNFLGWLGGELSGEIEVLFSPNDPAEYLFPPQRTLDAVSQLRGAGEGGREARQIGRAVEEREAFLADLREFRDRLDRAAKLYLYLDLNDGVVLNAAPLHELMPWKEAKGKWGELLAGKNKWSSIGKQFRQKGMI